MKYKRIVIENSIPLCKAVVVSSEHEFYNPKIIEMKIEILVPNDEKEKEELFNKINQLKDHKSCRVNLFMTNEDSTIYTVE